MRLFGRKSPQASSGPTYVVVHDPVMHERKPVEFKPPVVEKRPKRCRKWAIGTWNSHKNRGFYMQVRVAELEEMAWETNYCKYCNTKLDWSEPDGLPAPLNSPSLDRIYNTEYLDKGSLRIICLRCNMAKRDGTEAEYVAWLKQAGRHLNQ